MAALESGAASMRPAHQAREVRLAAGKEDERSDGFNEARASSAGSNRAGAKRWRAARQLQ